jgi:hypothetical protein
VFQRFAFAGRASSDDLPKAPDLLNQLDDYSVQQGVPLQSALLNAGEAIVR